MTNGTLGHSEMLARLVAQAETQGAHIGELRALVEEASDLGASRALGRLGLSDEQARADLVELRDLIKAWRDAKSSALKAALQWIVRGGIALLLLGLAVKWGRGI